MVDGCGTRQQEAPKKWQGVLRGCCVRSFPIFEMDSTRGRAREVLVFKVGVIRVVESVVCVCNREREIEKGIIREREREI